MDSDLKSALVTAIIGHNVADLKKLLLRLPGMLNKTITPRVADTNGNQMLKTVLHLVTERCVDGNTTAIINMINTVHAYPDMTVAIRNVSSLTDNGLMSNDNGRTALMQAVRYNRVTAATILLENGGRTNLLANAGESWLGMWMYPTLRVRGYNEEIPTFKDQLRMFRLLATHSTRQNHLTYMNDVTRHGAFSALHLGILEDDHIPIEKIQFVLENGVNPNLMDADGFTALHYYITKRDIQPWMLTYLLNSNCNPNIVNTVRSNTALQETIHYQTTNLYCYNTTIFTHRLSLLLDHGADLKNVNMDGDTALHMLLNMTTISEDAIQLCIQSNQIERKDIMKCNAQGQSVFVRSQLVLGGNTAGMILAFKQREDANLRHVVLMAGAFRDTL